jgi:hypothetical protein
LFSRVICKDFPARLLDAVICKVFPENLPEADYNMTGCSSSASGVLRLAPTALLENAQRRF